MSRNWALSILDKWQEQGGVALHRDLIPSLEVNEDVIYFDMQEKSTYESVTYKLDVDVPEDIVIACIQLIVNNPEDPYLQVGIVSHDSHTDFLEIKEWAIQCGGDHLVLQTTKKAIYEALGI